MPPYVSAARVFYEALANRDESFDGHVYVCVTTTGIFCRLSCPARTPRAEHCVFRARVSECIDAGFRPCKRCRPLLTVAPANHAIGELLVALDEHPDARSNRNGSGDDEVAGFQSSRAFEGAVARSSGPLPRSVGQRETLLASWIATPLGAMLAVGSATHLHLLEFMDREALPEQLEKLQAATSSRIAPGRSRPIDQAERELASYFAGKRAAFETPLALHATPFRERVWQELLRIPAGETRSYSEIARLIGQPRAVRAVARANGANGIAVMVPCHRVIAANGSLTGYGGGLWRKQRLIEMERQFRSRAAS